MSYANNLAQRKNWIDLGQPRTSNFSHCDYRAAHGCIWKCAHRWLLNCGD